MNAEHDCFTLFTEDISTYQLPEKFTFPFYYDPHPLALLAAKQLQQHLTTQKLWQHNFGLNKNDEQANAIGKMFGILVVENSQGELGYLSAFSGKLAEKSVLANFVPPVFDLFSKESFYLAEQAIINQLNEQLESLENNAEFILLNEQLAQTQVEATQTIEAQQALMALNRKQRKAQRAQANNQLDTAQLAQLKQKLGKESVAQKNELKALKTYWQAVINKLEQQVEGQNNKIASIKEQRKQLSNNLQHQLFSQYQFLNSQGEQQDLNVLFKDTVSQIPPAGAGDCAAPKLLQYAFKNKLKPIALAEFWWGAA
jgi:tRNA pseudouridine32 synthase/23S rRNA pseudouridine746 synthase